MVCATINDEYTSIGSVIAPMAEQKSIELLNCFMSHNLFRERLR
jgi:hypothetical protein